MRKIAIFIALMALLLLYAVPVFANGIPALPHAFYGTVTVNNNPAGGGTQISATVAEGEVITNVQNPLTTTIAGEYGSDGLYLLVQGDIQNGATITFYVNGRSTGQTATFEVGGGPTLRNLTVTIPTDGGGGGITRAPDIEANLFGEETDFSISEDGEILETIEATSEDGNMTLTIEEGTIALDEDGDPLSTLTLDVDVSPPDPPEDAHIIGLAYDFGPDGATFDPPITMTYTLDLDDLPEGVDPENLVIAYWDGDEWVELDSDVDVENNTITIEAEVEHFTTFAVIAMPPPALAPAVFTSSSLSISPLEVDTGQTVTISISVANTGEEEGSYTVTLKLNGVVEETREITLAGGSSETVTFTTAKDEAGTYSVDIDGLTGSFTVREVAPPPPALPVTPPPAEINWAIWGTIIGVAVFLAIFIPIRLRRRKLG